MDITYKYSLLNKLAKQEVDDYIDFLLQKARKRRKSTNSSYRDKILTVSTWSESDLKVYEENKNLFNNWNIDEW